MTTIKQPMPPALVLDFETGTADQVGNRQWWSESKEVARVVRWLRDTDSWDGNKKYTGLTAHF